jgi:hypothetical protein
MSRESENVRSSNPGESDKQNNSEEFVLLWYKCIKYSVHSNIW